MLGSLDMNLKQSFFPIQSRFSWCISRFCGRGHGGNSPKYTKQQPFLLLSRFIHSVEETVEESSDIPRLSSSDKQKFIDMMRGKLDLLFREVYRKNINPLLMCLAQEYLSDMKEDVEQKGINDTTSAPKGKGLMDDLLETKRQVSTAILEEKRKADKERMKSFPHINDVEEMCRASDHHQVGMERREKLMRFVSAWLGVLHFAGDIPHLQPHFRGISFTEKDAIKVEEEEEEVTPRNPHPSDPEWLQIANQILHLPTSMSETHVCDWYQAKASAYVKHRYPLRLFLVINAMLSNSESLPPLLAEWAELLQPKKNDWIALLYRLDNSGVWKYSKVAEHMLDEESFQDANMRDCLDIIYLYHKYNNSDFGSILNKMKDKGMLPDILFFALKAHMHSKAGNLDLAKEALDSAKDEFESLRSQVLQPDDKNCGCGKSKSREDKT